MLDLWFKPFGKYHDPVRLRRCDGVTLREYCIALESSNITGGNLKIKRKELFTEVASSCLSVLEAFHAHGLTYCDVKLDNIMICEKDEVYRAKMIDYGAVSTDRSACTWTTPGYVPSEVLDLTAKNISIDTTVAPGFFELLSQHGVEIQTKGLDKSQNAFGDLYALSLVLSMIYPYDVVASRMDTFDRFAFNLCSGLALGTLDASKALKQVQELGKPKPETRPIVQPTPEASTTREVRRFRHVFTDKKKDSQIPKSPNPAF
jgi:serine/threonine protein kinase